MPADRENARRRYTRALREVYATATPSQRAYGAEWYASALETARRIADENGAPLANVVGAIAALSPRNQWDENVADARLLCEWYFDADFHRHGDVPLWGIQPRIHAFRAQLEKACACLGAADPLTVLRGPKETAFYLNIMGDGDAVTVDVWATRAATRSALDTPGTRQRYEDIAAAYRRAARAEGVAPRDLQAAVWLALRDLTTNGNSGGGGWRARRAAAA